MKLQPLASAARVAAPLIAWATGGRYYLAGAAAGFAQALFVRLAQLYPLFDLIAEILLPQIRLFVVADAAGKDHVFACVQRKYGNAQHHALDGFGRVLGDGQAVAVVIATVHIGNREVGFVNGGFQCHCRAFAWGT